MNKTERELQAALLDELRHYAQTTTEFAAQLAGQAVNNVLEVFTGTIPPEGYITRTWHVAAGCLELSNWGNAGNFMTVRAGGYQGSVPSGTGCYVVNGGASRTVAVASREITIYGTAADRFSLQVFTAAIRPSTT